jgi:hypothetical protein
MILGGGGLRLENHFIRNGTVVTKLNDMYNASVDFFKSAVANTFYDNKVYVKGEYRGNDYGMQSLNTITGSWCNLTSYNSGKTIYGLETIGNKIYEVAALYSGGTTTIDIIPYTPLTDTWGTKRSFTHNHSEYARSCSYGNYIYIAYGYAHTSGSYTWHLKKYDTSASTLSNDLNFEIITNEGYNIWADLESNNDSIYFSTVYKIYKYNPATDSTDAGTEWTVVYPQNFDRLTNINNDIYYMSYAYNNAFVYLTKLDTSASTTSGSYINVYKAMFCCTSDNTQKLYVYGEAETPRYPFTSATGTTYCVIPK